MLLIINKMEFYLKDKCCSSVARAESPELTSLIVIYVVELQFHLVSCQNRS